MSRIGKKPIPLPKGVKIQIGDQLEVTGPKGTLTVPIPAACISSRPTAAWTWCATAISTARCTG
jgi:ribosomal protein L6P/L9E